MKYLVSLTNFAGTCSSTEEKSDMQRNAQQICHGMGWNQQQVRMHAEPGISWETTPLCGIRAPTMSGGEMQLLQTTRYTSGVSSQSWKGHLPPAGKLSTPGLSGPGGPSFKYVSIVDSWDSPQPVEYRISPGTYSSHGDWTPGTLNLHLPGNSLLTWMPNNSYFVTTETRTQRRKYNLIFDEGNNNKLHACGIQHRRHRCSRTFANLPIVFLHLRSLIHESCSRSSRVILVVLRFGKRSS